MTHSKVFKIVDHTVPGQHIREYARATAESQEDPLMIAVKQYVPLDNPNPQPGDVTIIGAHANGFPKEMYEALWEDLHAESKKAGFRIRAIWIADVTQQGQSGIINEFKLGNDPSWIDHARDLLHLINVKRADMPRPLIGIGHSFGGNALTNLALMHPRLLHSLVLLDPVISHFASTPGGIQTSPAASSINRRDLWPSRAAAEASFKKSKFFGSWDPRVLSAWCEFGVRECPTLVYPDHTEEQAGEKPVTLTTSKHQELFTFFRPTWDAFDAEGRKLLRPDLIPDFPNVNSPDLDFPVYRPEGPNTVVRLPHLRPSVLYIFGETSDVSPPILCEEKMRTTGTGVGGSGGQAKGRVKSVTLKGIGHLVAMEAPGDCSRHAAEFLGMEVERWKIEEREWEEWRKKDIREKGLLSKTWYEKIGQGKGPGKRQDKPAKL